LNSLETAQLMALIHSASGEEQLEALAHRKDIYSAPGPPCQFHVSWGRAFLLGGTFASQSEIALIALAETHKLGTPGVDAAMLQTLRSLRQNPPLLGATQFALQEWEVDQVPADRNAWPEFARLMRDVREQMAGFDTRNLDEWLRRIDALANG
jgi:hypothetical protein